MEMTTKIYIILPTFHDPQIEKRFNDNLGTIISSAEYNKIILLSFVRYIKY